MPIPSSEGSPKDEGEVKLLLQAVGRASGDDVLLDPERRIAEGLLDELEVVVRVVGLELPEGVHRLHHILLEHGILADP